MRLALTEGRAPNLLVIDGPALTSAQVESFRRIVLSGDGFPKFDAVKACIYRPDFRLIVSNSESHAQLTMDVCFGCCQWQWTGLAEGFDDCDPICRDLLLLAVELFPADTELAEHL